MLGWLAITMTEWPKEKKRERERKKSAWDRMLARRLATSDFAVDWAHFGCSEAGGRRRPFPMVAPDRIIILIIVTIIIMRMTLTGEQQPTIDVDRRAHKGRQGLAFIHSPPVPPRNGARPWLSGLRTD